jgi:hypothetical protein
MFTFFQHCRHSFKGFAAVTGIVSILLLQLGFTIFLRTSDIFEKSADIVRNADIAFYPLATYANPVATVPTEPVVTTSQIGDREVSISPRRFQAETAYFRKETVKRYHASPRYARKSTKLNTRVVFTDTIIRVKYTAKARNGGSLHEPSVEERPEGDPRSINVSRKADKRSFVSSVIPIVKKPYGWMKAMGSRIF